MIEKTLSMTPYKTSMLIDNEKRREMETEAIVGEPLRIARAKKIAVPNMEILYRLLSFYNRQCIEGATLAE